MSSGMEAMGVVALAVAAPVVAAAGAAWVLLETGKLAGELAIKTAQAVIEANRAVDAEIALTKRRLEETARHRKTMALAAHGQMADMCAQALRELERSGAGVAGTELEELKNELRQIAGESLPDDAERVESLTSLGYLKLDKILRRHRRLAELAAEDSARGLYQGQSLADLMEDLRVAVGAMQIKATDGMDVKAADPRVLERAKLNERFSAVTADIMAALAHIGELTETYGMPSSGRLWLERCFGGIDKKIEALCRPSTDNAALKKGIARLEEAYEQYRIMIPNIEKDALRMAQYYAIYAEAAEGLGERVKSVRDFKDAAAIERELVELRPRAKRAAECAKLYQKLGPEGYLCYAWDQELQAMGYRVHGKKLVEQMAQEKAKYARIDGTPVPFYEWDEQALTQLYEMAEECSLQLIVHEDDSVTMQTVAGQNSEGAVGEQRLHCERLKELHERLRENWFVLYDYKETASAETVMTTAAWRSSDEYSWDGAKMGRRASRRRSDKKGEQKKQQMQ